MKKISKLSLRYETIRTIASDRLTAVAGGGDDIRTFAGVCLGPTRSIYDCPTALCRQP